ncbi:MAG: alpha/beta fold hydrolase [Armatimonadetes bacterium]|nr:alpha/beta fold hydrolase [Armatimonadota bacterium]
MNNLDSEVQVFDRKLRDILALQKFDGELEVEVKSQESDGAISRKLICIRVGEAEWMGAYLLEPDVGKPVKRPGILAIHQHGGDFSLGKSEPAGLSANRAFHYGLDLAKRGFVVLCPDLLAFEDRQPPEWKRREGSAPDGFWYERFEALRLLLNGSSLQAKYLADLARALDFLCSVANVDEGRIGAIGHSLGGQEALWLTWFDSRISACVSSCGFALIRAIVRDQINHNMALYVPGLLQIGDVDLLACAIAPRALFFSAGDADSIFPVDSVRAIAERLRERYAHQGALERVEYAEFVGGHGFPDDIKERAYDFLQRNLSRE